jgi:uncharacterized protein
VFAYKSVMKGRPRGLPPLDQRFAQFRLRVVRSRIDRFGVVADEPIPAGRKVIEYTGEHISMREADRRHELIVRSRGRKRFYFFQVHKKLVLDGAVGGSGAELINHSCDPNLKRRRSGDHILYFSRRRIRRGEELTLDYHYAEDAFRQKCHCGSKKCRGTLNVK